MKGSRFMSKEQYIQEIIEMLKNTNDIVLIDEVIYEGQEKIIQRRRITRIIKNIIQYQKKI